MKRWIFLWLVLALFGSFSARADGLIVIENVVGDDTHWPPHPHPQPDWPRPPHQHIFAPLEVAYHHVDVKIDGQIAKTSIDQEFHNPNPQRLEGTYLFPVPKGAQ